MPKFERRHDELGEPLAVDAAWDAVQSRVVAVVKRDKVVVWQPLAVGTHPL